MNVENRNDFRERGLNVTYDDLLLNMKMERS